MSVINRVLEEISFKGEHKKGYTESDFDTDKIHYETYRPSYNVCKNRLPIAGKPSGGEPFYILVFRYPSISTLRPDFISTVEVSPSRTGEVVQ